MLSACHIGRPGHPAASRNAISSNRLTIFEVDDSTRCDGFENNCNLPGSRLPGNEEDHPTLTERVLSLLDKRSA
jgi:hypothetical protein